MENVLDIEASSSRVVPPPLLRDPIELCHQCRNVFPSEPNPAIPVIADYVAGNPGNHISIGHEASTLLPLLQKAEAELVGYDEAIRQMDDAMLQLEERRTRLWKLKERLRWISRPSIRRLPPELLIRIFYTCWRDGYPLREPSQLDEYERFEQPNCRTPLVLSHVSAQWRALAFQESKLWSCIGVRFHVNDEPIVAQRIYDLTKFCLEKSKARPLHIFFYAPSLFDQGARVPYDPTLHRPVLAELYRHYERWGSGVLRLHGEDPHLPNEFPALEFLIVHRATMSAGLTAAQPLYATRLRILETARMDARLLSGYQHMHALERFSTDEPSIDLILGILQCSPKLREVKLNPRTLMTYQHRLAADTNPIPALIPHLESLDVSHFHYASAILPYLTLPSLTSFKASGEALSYHVNAPEFVEFLRRSRPPLDSLDINGVALFPGELTRSLSLVPSITKLHVVDMSMMNLIIGRDFLQEMTISSSASGVVLLPNLLDLSLSAQSCSLDGAILVDMVRSRVFGFGGARLRNFTMKCREPALDREIRNELLELVGENLGVDVQD
ncbi:hypothetical protein Moror_13069 [Moniliophthora roreri MCA 2997]|uniref:Uncharacterized protein n=2 Tax=Moniliophthora roreri TaxID=221103 RepID=V2YQ67_MONRO|nr:hypothetical protein Moror_13069 [Moniliophthora roreri MCA 2997]